VYSGTGSKVWGPKPTHPYAIGHGQSVTYDGALLMSLHHWGNWRNRTFDPADGATGAEQTSAAFLDWPRAADAAHLAPGHLQLVESEGHVYAAVFDADGALRGVPDLLVRRAEETCTGQCARMAVLPGTIGLLYWDEGAIHFASLCR